jgi:hypothetical protein
MLFNVRRKDGLEFRTCADLCRTAFELGSRGPQGDRLTDHRDPACDEGRQALGGPSDHAGAEGFASSWAVSVAPVLGR